MPKIGGKDKQSLVYPQRGVLLSIKKKKKKIKEQLTTDATQVVDLKLLSNPLREGSQTQTYMSGKVPFIWNSKTTKTNIERNWKLIAS